ncbi:SDR family NAD(P)-dependent oxidoreductase [Streptomyces sp. NPDC051567]|uniref:SDR family NAD(P)-dependent oxidoreductase n=1 Tax=Streptomyces sp. NPDC051567 TaxID=3365660 RepID=UPI003796D7FA
METYEKTFDGREPFIAQHRSAGVGILPAAVQLEMALAGIARRRGFTPLELSEVAFVRPFTVADDSRGTVRLDITPGTPGTAGAPGPQTRFELSGVGDTGRKSLSTGSGREFPSAELAPVTPWHVPCPQNVTPAELYGSWSRAGLEYGPDFRTVRELHVGDGTAEAVLHTAVPTQPWHANPLLVDGVFQVVSCALQEPADATSPRPLLPIGVARLTLRSALTPLTAGVTVRVRRTGVEGAYSVADALVLSPSGEVVVELTGVRMRRMPTPGSPQTARTSRIATEIRWAPAPAPGSRSAAAGTWVVLHNGDHDTQGLQVVRSLRAEGARVVEVLHEAPDTPAGERLVLPDPDEAAFRTLWENVADPVAGVVHLWSTGPVRPAEPELRAGLYSCLAAVKTLGERQRKAQFLVVTENAQPVAAGDAPAPERAALWGLVRTAAIEYRGLRPRLVDLDPASAGALLAELGEGPVEVGYRDGVRHAPERVPYHHVDRGRPAVRRGGRYLILGGHGGLGLEVAARFAREGAGAVALVSRSGGSDAVRARTTEIESSGCKVASYAADVSAPGALAAVVAGFRGEFGDLHGVVHAAGTLKDGLIRTATADDFAAVLRPKVDGLRELADAVAGSTLDFAVLFASVSGAFGNLGQGGYAAANTYLDAFAHAHKAPWISIDWGLWGDVGMGTAVADQLRRRGVRPLGTDEALDALMTALRGDVRQLVIAHPDASETGAPETGAPKAASGAPAVTAPDSAAADPVTPATGERTGDELARFMAEQLSITDFDRSVPLSDYGINSIMSVELSEELSRRWKVSLPATLFLEYGDFAELAQALTDRYAATPPAPTPAAPAPVPAVPVAPAAAVVVTEEPAARPVRQAAPVPGETGARHTSAPAPLFAPPSGTSGASRSGDIAVVAIAGDLPGATGLDGLWPMLRSGGDSFTEVPAARWNIDDHFEEHGPHMTGTYCRTGAFVSDTDRFDPKFFGISVREADEMDPQQKLLLEHAWSVIDASGLTGRQDIGVFVGATYTHHRDTQGLETVGPHTALGSMNAVLANRISYALDLTGPSQTVDTLCSSSLVAVQQAVTGLRAGHCGAAIVAACNVGLTPWYYRSLSRLGALSHSRPRPFDDRADGFLPGEGAVVVMLKRLDDAERDGDRIWGVIRGTAVNHGGRGSALPVPRSGAQAAVIRAALADAGVPATGISLVETHGTATRLGDPIEIAALTEVFGGDAQRRDPCFIGSVKANIGHLEPASGLAGLVKVLLCLQHKEIPPLAGFASPGAHIDFPPGLFVVPTAPRPWHPEGPRRAGISAFGMGGTNAHIVVEEYVAAGPATPAAALDTARPHPSSAPLPHASPSPQPSPSPVRVTAPEPADADRVTRAHRVFGEETVPAALLVAQALERATVLTGVTLTARATGRHPLTSDLAERAPGQTVTFRHGGRNIVHLTLGAPEGAAQAPAPHDVDALRAGYGRTLAPAGLYAWFAAKGMDLAAPLTAITGIHYGPAGVLAALGGTEENPPVRTVAAIDAALQTMAVLTLADPAASPLTYLPVSIGRIARWDDPARAAFVHLRFAGQDDDGTRRGSATLLRADGRALLSVEDVVYRPLPNTANPSLPQAATPAPAPLPGPGLDRTADGLPADDRTVDDRTAGSRAVVEETVLGLVRQVLRDPDVTPTSSLSAVGLDSMLATMVTVEIEETLRVRLSPTDVLAARDCRALAAVVAELAPRGAAEHTPAPAPAGTTREARPTTAAVTSVTPEPAQARTQDMAVIGLACALPGAADPAGFWSMLSRGGTGIGRVPSARWTGDDRADESALGGFLENIEEFDARFFDFFPKQAEVLDPQVRWLLRSAWEALESAGIPAMSMPTSSTGVFVGASYQHYKDYNVAPELDAPSGLGNHNAFLANRVSYFLDLRGPSMTIDTLCSSSLVALHTAIRSIRDGECEQALVAGVRLAMSPLHYVAMRNLRALSPTGESRAFDASADGFVPGEGVVTVVVKPLVDALRDGDRIRGVIRGSAVNHGGRTSGLTVPSSGAQREVIAAALRDAGVGPESIQMVEAHGTGTSLGDPIEVEGLTRAWREYTDRSQFCAIGSLKSNIGHLEPAAGLAGLVKVLLAMEHEVIPPTLHVTRPNDHIRFEDTPFYVADRPVAWPRTDVPRRAAVSAFGMGGANAHLIVEEPPALPARVPLTPESHVLRITAATEEAVRELAAAYAERFAASHDDRETADLCHTANVGRSPLAHQSAVNGRGAAELAEALRAVADGRTTVVRADTTPPATTDRTPTGTGPATDRHTAVVDAVRGGDTRIDWASLSAPGSRTTELPTYPFARGHHWHVRPSAAADPAATPESTESTAALRTTWRAQEADGPAAGSTAGPVRVVCADRGTAELVSAALRDLGVPLAAADAPATGVIVVAAPAPDPSNGPATDTEPDLSGFWTELRGLVSALPPGGRLLWADSRSAAVHPEERARLLPEAAAKALTVRAACAENQLAATVLDLDPQDPAGARARQIAAEFAAESGGRGSTSDAAAYRRGTRFVPEPAALRPGPATELSGDGYYLVTGGLGAVGRRLTAHLITCGAQRIAVVGRSRADDGSTAFLRDLNRRATVEYLPCDITDEAAVTAAAARFGKRWGRLRGVVHSSGGVNPFGSVRRRSWADAARVTSPKIPGSLNAVRLAKAQGADFAVLVSSIAGILPQAGRGLVDYALANAYQLALAEREHGSVTAVTAHAWPNWEGTGMEADASFAAAHSITVDQALSGFAAHLRSGGSVTFPGSPPPAPAAQPAPAARPQREQPVREQPVERPVRETPVPAAAPTGAHRTTAATEAMSALVRDAFRQVLGEDPGDRVIRELGLDSLAIADIATAIERSSGQSVDPSLLMQVRTAGDVAARLADEGEPPASAPPATPVPASAPSAAGSVPGPRPAPASTLSSLLRPLLTQSRGH